MAKKLSMIEKMRALVRSRPGAFEKPSQEKRSIPVGFAQPENLEARMLRVVRSELFRESVRRRAQQADPEMVVKEGPESPHELIFHEGLGREMTRWEFQALERDQAEFEHQAKLRADQIRKIREDAKRKKKEAGKALPPPDESDDE